MEGYCGARGVKERGQQTTRKHEVQAIPVGCNPIGFMKTSHMSNGLWCKEIRGPKMMCLSPIKRKSEVTAFGPKHAEHARRFYKSTGRQPEFPQNLGLQDGTKVSPMEVSNYRIPSCNSVIQTSGSSCCAKSKIYVPIKSQPQEMVLKMARISPRPSRMQFQTPKASLGFGDKFPTMVKKSNSFHKTRHEMELKDAPIFQMLCEMTRTE